MKSLEQLAQNLKFNPNAIAPVQESPAGHFYQPPFTLHQLDTNGRPQLAKVIDRVRNWQQDRKQDPRLSFVLSSTGAGVGKTHILKAINWSSVSVPDLFLGDDSPITPTNNFYTAERLIVGIQSEKPFKVERWISPKSQWVCIDDIGTEPKFDYMSADAQRNERHAVYTAIVNYCYERNIGVLISTNLDLKDGKFQEWIGFRAWSRLSEMAPRNYIYDLSELPDYRQQKAGRL